MIEIRIARPAEFEIAAALRAEMAFEMGSDLDAMNGDWRVRFGEYFGAKQAAGTGALFLALQHGRAVGTAAIALTDEWRAHCFGLRFAFVNAVYVKPSYRRQGIGRDLMIRAVAWARDCGCARVRLRTSTEGRPLYEALGFRTGREMELDL